MDPEHTKKETLDEQLILLIPNKKIKLTNYDRCVICQNDTNETLRKAKDCSSLISALKMRQDDVHDRLEIDYDKLNDMSVMWHKSCYSVCTLQRNVQAAVKRRNRTQTPVDPKLGLIDPSCTESEQQNKQIYTRSQEEPRDWSKCIICQKKYHKKDHALISISTTGACDTLYEAAQELGDEEMTSILTWVQKDLMAAEGKYHKDCHSSYISKANYMKCKKAKEAEQKGSKHAKHEEAFQTLVEEIAPNIQQGKVYNMSSLLEKYRTLLENKNITPESYSSQRLKLRLINYFGDSIVFHKQSLCGSLKVEILSQIHCNVYQKQMKGKLSC